MKRKIITFVMMCMLIAGNCCAMHFSGLSKLGNVGGFPTGGIGITGASYNNGTSYKNGQFDKHWKEKIYDKGAARYGANDAGLWVYYDCSKSGDYREAYMSYFGDRDKKVTVRLGTGEGEGVNIYSIKNDENRALYFLAYNGCVFGAEVYVVMGYDKNGKFVKYIDTTDVVNNYLGKKNVHMKGMHLSKYYCRGNSIIVEYMDPRISHDHKNPVGEFRFKWDDAAQWFGVEQVVY